MSLCKKNKVILVSLLSAIFSQGCAANQESKSMQTEQNMSAILWQPANLENLTIECADAEANTNGDYLTSKQVNYNANGWEERVSKDWTFFTVPASTGKILVIDNQIHQGTPSYRYLSNGTQHDLFEPWSSSKVFAYTGAMAALREQYNVGADGFIGQYNIADLITSIHSYEEHGTANGDSNSIASYFVNLATRDRLTRLLHKNWLNLTNAHIIFSGAYGVDVLSPEPHQWRSQMQSSPIALGNLLINSEDPAYLPYKCDSCGKTGNKAMSTLAIAEWLKRLAMHSIDTKTAHPHLTYTDVDVLFHGSGHTDEGKKTAGMMRGISLQLGLAIARGLTGKTDLDTNSAEQILNESTSGKWRIYQKIGWGPSETRGTGENVMLAHVCLPLEHKTASFTVAAQASHPEPTEESVWKSGEKMQIMLDQAMQKLLGQDKK